jgi:hypothetical protein
MARRRRSPVDEARPFARAFPPAFAAVKRS